LYMPKPRIKLQQTNKHMLALEIDTYKKINYS